MALLENDFEEKRFEGFSPGPEFFAHCGSMCQARSIAARFWNLMVGRVTPSHRRGKSKGIGWQARRTEDCPPLPNEISSRAWQLPAEARVEIPARQAADGL